MFSFKQPVKPAANRFTGNLYTLIDGASFPTTGHLISLLKYHRMGTLIGEESGARGSAPTAPGISP